MEHKVVAFELKDVNFEEGVFEGYAAVFGNVDDGGDVIEKGAFTKTLAERGHRVKICWQHDFREPIGKPVELREDEHGLYVKGKISLTTRGRDVLTLLRDKVVTELSIGYDPVKAEPKGAVRRLKEVKLYEISPVTQAMNPLAVITEVKKTVSSVERTPWLDAIETKAITDEDKRVLKQEIAELNMTDLVATHRRLHQFAAQGNVLTNFTRADMEWFHAQVEKELRARAEDDERDPPEPTPLKWPKSEGDGKDEADGSKDGGKDDEDKHLPRRVREIIEREKKKAVSRARGERAFEKVLGTKAADLVSTMSQAVAERELWDKRWKIQDALWNVIDEILKDEEMDGAAKTEALAKCLDQFKDLMMAWLAQYVAVVLSKGKPTIMERKSAEPGEAKEGRVLSKRNRDLLQQAIDALQALLAAAEPAEEPDGKSTPSGEAEGAEPPEVKDADPEIQSVFERMTKELRKLKMGE